MRCDHGGAMRADLGPLADDGDVEGKQPAAALGDQGCGMGEKPAGIGTPPARIAGREMLSDIAGADGAQNGIGQRMKPDIGIRMAFETLVMGKGDAADHHLVPRCEAMHVETVAAADIGSLAPRFVRPG